MIELIILTVLSRHIAECARERGKSPTEAVLFLLAMWVAGTIGGVAFMYAGGAKLLLCYCGAWIGGIVGARAAFTMVCPDTSHVPPAAGTWRGTANGRHRRLLVIVALLVAILTAAVVTLCSLPPAPPVYKNRSSQ